MLATTYSPGLKPASQNFGLTRSGSASAKSIQASPIVKPHSTHVYLGSPQTSQHKCSSTDQRPIIPPKPAQSVSRSTQTLANHPEVHTKPLMVDAQTQYSPPLPSRKDQSTSASTSASEPAAQIESLHITPTHARSVSDLDAMPAAPTGSHTITTTDRESRASKASYKRNHSIATETDLSNQLATASNHATTASSDESAKEERRKSSTPSSGKKMRQAEATNKLMPQNYSVCATRDLVLLISSMLMDLIQYNDTIPLHDGHLTRFHSRAPPAISVTDYLQRLTTHATLSPPILLSMVFYIDKLCALYPAFTISSLTVHRFLITAATVASKGLSDSFWTNRAYARVGGVSFRELAYLELEFLVRVDWKIVPQPEVLVDYYKSLVNRTVGYELESVATAEARHAHETGLVADRQAE